MMQCYWHNEYIGQHLVVKQCYTNHCKVKVDLIVMSVW
jgi:hypothetical protein